MIMMSILAVLNRLSCIRACRKYLRKEILPPLGKVTKRPEEETHLIKSKVVIIDLISLIIISLLWCIAIYGLILMINNGSSLSWSK